MQVIIGLHEQFKRDFKRLRKKYRSLTTDYAQLLADLEVNPLLGTDLGGGLRKVRMGIASKGKGKSGGARVITYTWKQVAPDTYKISLLTLYDKSEMENISDAFIQQLLQTLTNK